MKLVGCSASTNLVIVALKAGCKTSNNLGGEAALKDIYFFHAAVVRPQQDTSIASAAVFKTMVRMSKRFLPDGVGTVQKFAQKGAMLACMSFCLESLA